VILNPTESIFAMSRIFRERPSQLICCDFREILAQSGAGDTVYLDPPYVPLSPTSNFNAYHPDGFTGTDQGDLARMARQAAARGATVVVSNHDTPLSRELYEGATLISLQVTRSISASASSRTKVGEILDVFSPTETPISSIPWSRAPQFHGPSINFRQVGVASHSL
jgi:DNA adenine methylase